MTTSWRLVDAAALAAQAKYTFFRPSATVLEQLAPGQRVKLIFALETEISDYPEDEKLWVSITERSGQSFTGQLQDEPFYIDNLEAGQTISFESRHIVDTDPPDPAGNPLAPFAHRCLVSRAVLEGGSPVALLYREKSRGEFKKGIEDSGWRILAADDSPADLDRPDGSSFIALGVLLNREEHLLPLLDAPAGSAYRWNEQSQRFEAATLPQR